MKQIEQITQFNQFLNKPIKDFGCYLLCLHYYVAKYKNLDFNVFDINKAYDIFLDRNYINNKCYIMQPTKILRYYGLRTDIRFGDANYIESKNEFVITRVKIGIFGGYHFLATTKGKVSYDSLKLKQRNKRFKFNSTRIYSLL